MTTGTDSLKRLFFVFQNFGYVFKHPLPSLALVDLLVSLAVAGGLKLVIYLKSRKKKVYRDGEEHGSARFGTSSDILPFLDRKKSRNNIILSQTEGITMGKPSSPKFARNKNVLVVGGSGSGKTRFFIKPNLMNLYGSYVVSDPKGTLILECGQLLKDNGYTIKVVNTINFDKSLHYNPFAYLKSEKDVLMLVNTIVANTKGEGDKSGEDFWVKAEKMLLTALIAYIWSEAPQEAQNFTTLLEMLNSMEVREEDETFENAVDLLFKALVQKTRLELNWFAFSH